MIKISAWFVNHTDRIRLERRSQSKIEKFVL
jgi:hypothetical protein